MVTAEREVHILDDNDNPTGPVLCGKTSTDVLGDGMKKKDRLCRKCAERMLWRLNDYADEIDILREGLRREQGQQRELRGNLARSQRMLNQLLERFLAVPPVD
jgi:hypothetical protein